MAEKPTIYKARVDLSDIDRGHYDKLSLTLARHPSETLERMLVRLLAFCFNASENLVFCKGLSDADEADLWSHGLDGTLELWIDVGEPAVERIKKATRIAGEVKVYCFNTRATTWWSQHGGQFGELRVSVYRFPWDQLQALERLASRNMELSVTISGGSAYIAAEDGECEITAEVLQEMH